MSPLVVVKLKLGFEAPHGGLEWFSGTGWLIQKDLLVTAGHCVYSHGHRRPHVISIKAYLGYHGKDSESKDYVELRHGYQVATPTQWAKAQHVPHDVAFIQLMEKFDNVSLITYEDTPNCPREETLLVVGYPCDLPANGEGGSLMHVGKGLVSYDINSSHSKGMLEYPISTFYGMLRCLSKGRSELTSITGSSGSPVLRQQNNELIAIGTHRGGSHSLAKNMATAIGRRLHTDIRYDRYEEFFAQVHNGLLRLDQVPGQYDLVKMRSLPNETDDSVLNRTY